ncbi:MAG: hypothetical protein HQ538_06820 [Parcubacteria group bacterium]|nr:hypothetical protein [Parcubacteria group bacterium]
MPTPETNDGIERYADSSIAQREDLIKLRDLLHEEKEGEINDLETIHTLSDFCLSKECDPILRDLIFRKVPAVEKFTLNGLLDQAIDKLRK